MKRTVIATTLVSAIWLVVIAWWRATGYPVTTTDLVLYLLALPAVALIAVWLIASRTSTKNIHDAPVQEDTVSGITQDVTDENSHGASMSPLPVLRGWVSSSLGISVEEFANAVVARRTRPTPDSLLSNDDGYPVLTGRVNDLDISPILHALEQTRANDLLKNAPDNDAWRDVSLRALALLGTMLDQMFADWPFALPSDQESDSHVPASLPLLRGSSGLSGQETHTLNLKVKLLLPPNFHPCEMQLARAYLAQRLQQLPASTYKLNIDLIVADENASALALIKDFGVETAGGKQMHALLLLACDSSLCSSIVDEWSLRQCLFDPHRPGGLMMGEGAFGILLANEVARAAATTPPLAYLTQAVRYRRESSADAPGKPSHSCLAETIEKALQLAGIPGTAVQSVACDADHRPSRTLECIGAMMIHTPQLDAIQNRLATNESCGHLGCASVPGLLAAAVGQAVHTQAPVLLFNVSHDTDRAAAVLLPNFEADTISSYSKAA